MHADVSEPRSAGDSQILRSGAVLNSRGDAHARSWIEATDLYLKQESRRAELGTGAQCAGSTATVPRANEKNGNRCAPACRSNLANENPLMKIHLRAPRMENQRRNRTGGGKMRPHSVARGRQSPANKTSRSATPTGARAVQGRWKMSRMRYVISIQRVNEWESRLGGTTSYRRSGEHTELKRASGPRVSKFSSTRPGQYR